MKQNRTNRNSERARILVERVYVGERTMEEVFSPINEEVTRRNIEEKMKLNKGA